MTSGYSFLSTCVANNRCDDASDIAEATSRYDQYCALYTSELAAGTAPVSTPASTTTGASGVVTVPTSGRSFGFGRYKSSTVFIL
jgi:hypothetical protein